MILDRRGRERRAVYLPAECWAWLERDDRSPGARNDALETLVRAAMKSGRSTNR